MPGALELAAWLAGLGLLVAYANAISAAIAAGSALVGSAARIEPSSAWWLLVPIVQWPWGIVIQLKMRTLFRKALGEDYFSGAMWWGLAAIPFNFLALGLRPVGDGFASFLLGLCGSACLVFNWFGVSDLRRICVEEHALRVARAKASRVSGPHGTISVNAEAVLEEQRSVDDADAFEMSLKVQPTGRDGLMLLEASARAGNIQAQRTLGQRYQRGQGVLQDFVMAHAWFNLAASRGDQPSAEARDALTLRMTAAQLAEAQLIAREKAKS